MTLKNIALTMGDPAGIGPELCLNVIQNWSKKVQHKLTFVGDYLYLRQVAKKLRISLPPSRRIRFEHIPIRHGASIHFGRPTVEAGEASGRFIEKAVSLAQSKEVDAIVTCPINKVSFYLGGWGRKYRGHTEMLASLTGTSSSALMLCDENLRAIHVTSHIPLKEVPKKITKARIVDTIRLAVKGLRMLKVNNYRIGVCALNPHGGDGGLMGGEEREIILPAIHRAKKLGYRVEGPIPSDVIWPEVEAGRYDIGVAMYHDQGQIPLKYRSSLLKRDSSYVPTAVNVTVGLPFIRTSPAHGTAYDKAGKGIASSRSLWNALTLAMKMAK